MTKDMSLVRQFKSTIGRPKGSVNKTTQGIKLAMQCAFDEIGGVEALAKWARANRGEFYKLWVRTLPKEIIGDPERPIAHSVVITWGGVEVQV